MKIIMIILYMISCSKNNFTYDNKYKNDINFYFNNLDKLDMNCIQYVIEEAEKENIKALFLYAYLLAIHPNNENLKSKNYLLKDTDSLIKYLDDNNEFLKLGLLYHYGVKGKLVTNLDKATEYYNIAIKIGCFKATYYLELLNHGELEANTDRAIEYYNKAAEIDNFNALSNLGNLYVNAINVRQLDSSFEKATELYNKSSSMEYQAKCNTGYLYNMLVNGKLSFSIDEAIKCAFSLYEKYNYKHHILDETFILNNNREDFDNNEYKEILSTYISNINECYGIVLGKKIAHDNSSTISLFKHTLISDSLFISCNYICNYLESMLDLLSCLENYNFMIDCIKLKDSSKFENNESDYLNVITLGYNEYLTLGDYKNYKKLVDIMNGKEQLLDHINKLISNLDNSIDLHNALNEIINIESQFYNILIHTCYMRNNNFKNKYEALFK